MEAMQITAAVLVIGDEILSGRTRDTNAGTIAETLTSIGIELREVRFVPDETERIVAALNALRAEYTYVFTTGGIGPTHDDITADAVAAAFGVGIDHRPEAVELIRNRFPHLELNEARLRMARIPDGAELVENSISAAPGFRIGNVFVMAGVPAIMRAMLEWIVPRLETGRKLHSETVETNLSEGEVAADLREIAERHSAAKIGSYPYRNEKGAFTRIVVRAHEREELAAACADVDAMVTRLHAARGPG
jgi:molybdenum cofactor synthesis domain-containing protein